MAEDSSVYDDFDRVDRFIREMTTEVERPSSARVAPNNRSDNMDDYAGSEERPNTTKSRMLANSALSGARLARTPVAPSNHYRSIDESNHGDSNDVRSLADSHHVTDSQISSSDSFLITELRDTGGDNVGAGTQKGEWEALDYIREHSVTPTQPEVGEADDDEYDTDLDIEEELEELNHSLNRKRLKKGSEETHREHDPTGRSMYEEICERLGVVPVSYFCRHITDPVIVMRHHGLGPNGARAMAKILKTIVTCEKLDLSANWIEGDGGRFMAKVFQENDYIHEIKLADNRLGSEGAIHFCKMLHDNATLRSIDLSGNGFSDEDAELWAVAMEENKYCRKLNLSRNYFGDDGAKKLGPAIGSNDILEELDLSWNQIRQRGGVCIAKGLKENIRIKVCNLSWNGLGTSGGKAIADALVHNEALVELDISGNRIDTHSAELIVKAAGKNELLKVLKMGCNPISTSACVNMIGFLQKSDITVLELLDLTDVPVEFNYLKAAADYQKQRPAFVHVHGPVMRSGNTQADVGKPGINPHLVTNPLMVLREHIVISDSKILDVLQKYDTDHSYTVSKDEFTTALQEIGVPLEREHLNEISERLAKTDDGKIYYGDVLKRLQPPTSRVKTPEESSFTFGFTKSRVPVEQ